MEWIKASEQLPEYKQIVDIYVDSIGRITDFRYEGDGLFWNQEFDITHEIYGYPPVTHWMPLPLAPSQKE